ncbi:MAG TPA: DUF4180 domain-containing protein [Bacteroidota bacterium]
MELQSATHGGRPYIRSSSPRVMIGNPQDVLDLLAFASEHGTNLFVLGESNIAPAFYDLKSGLAGEVAQKLSNYGARVAIVGSFQTVRSDRFREFMAEANKGNQLRFTADEKSALAWLMRE